MKHYTLLILGIFVFYNSSWAQKPDIRCNYQEMYFYDDKENLIHTEIYKFGEKIEKIDYFYDTNGKIIRTEDWLVSNTNESGDPKLYAYTTYLYDKRNRLYDALTINSHHELIAEKKIYYKGKTTDTLFIKNKQNNIFSKSKYKNNKLTEIIYNEGTSCPVYEYYRYPKKDKQRKYIDIKNSIKNNIGLLEYKYDEKGNLIYKINYSYSLTEIIVKYEMSYAYNEKKQLVSLIKRNINKEKISETTYEYNNKGLLVIFCQQLLNQPILLD